ncbi:acetyl-CoA carboxylase biotin carboxyl carrier protein [Clostridium sp. HBUAS56010]|uniref:acetyl-CoA carboxylase biotin carboxyl carrier protein n=1 Tax=Clostridium sp. HBUAS56010 TaxID=2571127 RepID=UPI00117884D6|nr:acetyl-CoA carboxylase biotin carboxyl carrier protein [Clostridium sp. HBUAS56010]
MEINDIIRLMQAVSEQGLTSFRLEEGDLKLCIKKEKELVNSGNAACSNQPVIAAGEPALRESGEIQEMEISSDKVVSSPLVGTFYDASSPEGEPFVKVGDVVKKGQILGIIEAMKLMNEIECEYDGVVEAVLVENEDVVEYGQPLFRIR